VVDLRDRQGLSQEALADRAGLHHTQVGRIERGERLPNLLTLAKLADGFGITLSELLRSL
jgi:transcriptional regulator with XRE-family HTH domain